MAVLTGISNAVRSGIAGVAGQAVKAGGNAVRNIAGLNKEGNNSALGSTFGANKGTSSNILTYPINVDSDPQQGHYIMFEILRQDPAKLISSNKKKAVASAIATIEHETRPRDKNGKVLPPTAAEKAQKAATAAHDLKEGKKHSSAKHGGQSMQLSKNATVSIDKLIALYMPPSLSVSYNSKYGPSNISAMGMMGKTALDAFMGKNGINFDTALEKGLDEFKQGAETAVMAILDTAAPGATALLALEKGAIRTPKMELMFEGIQRREFSFEFVFIPKSAREAQIVQDIVHQFKFHMASNYTDGTFREMDIPSFFNIRYMYKSAENPFLNKISTCALENMDVSYGGDRFVGYEEGVPQTTKISLKFKELEIITKSAIAAGA